jgi:CHAD domain-containing protein
MGLRLRRRESVAEGWRRLLQAHVARLRDCVLAEPVTPKHVHQARQGLKQIRALIRLLRGHLPPQVRDEGREWCRRLAGSLASSRDATVLVQTLERLAERFPEANLDLAEWQTRLLSTSAGEQPTPQPDLEALDKLCEWASQAPLWALPKAGWRLLAPGLRRTYRAGRRALHQARSSGRDEDFHEWRKRVKDRWYQLAVLRRMRGGRVRAQLASLRNLAKKLGREHDLTMLVDRLSKLEPKPEVEALVELARTAQLPLRRRALRLGTKLYRAAPRRALAELHTCWRSWRKGKR